ncbi:MAG: acylphosphatase [Motiliproteus sp.]|jgi:acylphosphatase
MQQLRLHLWITGRVQGVWFRLSTKQQADALGVNGWVRNLDDGRVEALLAGEANAVRQLETWLNIGPELANVADVEAQTEALESETLMEGFEVR